jgi:hypothetical protein
MPEGPVSPATLIETRRELTEPFDEHEGWRRSGRAALLGSIGRFLAKGIAETTRLGPEEFGEAMADTLRQVRSRKTKHQTH